MALTHAVAYELLAQGSCTQQSYYTNHCIHPDRPREPESLSGIVESTLKEVNTPLLLVREVAQEGNLVRDCERELVCPPRLCWRFLFDHALTVYSNCCPMSIHRASFTAKELGIVGLFQRPRNTKSPSQRRQSWSRWNCPLEILVSLVAVALGMVQSSSSRI